MNTLDEFKKACNLVYKKNKLMAHKKEFETLIEINKIVQERKKGIINSNNKKLVNLILLISSFMFLLSLLISFFIPNIVTIIISFISIITIFLITMFKIEFNEKEYLIESHKKNIETFFIENNLKLEDLETFIKKYIDISKRLTKNIQEIKKELSLKDYQYLINSSSRLTDEELKILESWFLEFRKNNREAKEQSLKVLISEESSLEMI